MATKPARPRTADRRRRRKRTGHDTWPGLPRFVGIGLAILGLFCLSIVPPPASAKPGPAPQDRRCLDSPVESLDATDRRQCAGQLAEQAFQLHDTGNYRGARAIANRGLALVAGKAVDPLASSLWNARGLADMGLADYLEARSAFEQSLALLEPATPRQGSPANQVEVAKVLNNLGVLARLSGDPEQALRHFEESIDLVRAALGPDNPTVAHPLGQLAAAQTASGRYGEADRTYQEALDLLATEPPPGRLHRALALGSRATNAHFMGRLDLAEQGYREAIEAFDTEGYRQHPERFAPLIGLAMLLREVGRNPESAEQLEAIIVELDAALPGPHPIKAAVVGNLAEIRREQGSLAEAERLGRRALADREATLGRWHPETAISLNNMARLQIDAGRPDEALTTFEQAYVAAAATGDPRVLWQVGINLMFALAPDAGIGLGGSRNLPLAIFYGKRALAALEETRAGLAALPTESRLAFFARFQAFYSGLADRLIEADRIDEAMMVLELMREREVLEYTRAAPTTPAMPARPQTPLESHWAERLETAVGALASATDALRRFDAGNPAGQSVDAGAQSRRQSLQATLAERERDLHAALEAVRAAFTRYAESLPATPPTGPGIRTASALRGDLPAGTALLQIIALPDHLRLLLIDRNGEQTHRIAQDRLALNGRVTTFLDLLRHPRRDVVPQSRQLYDLLIGPVRSELDRRGVRTLLVSTTGALRYLPFGALHDGKAYLVESFATVLYSPLGRSSATGQAATRPAASGPASGPAAAGQAAAGQAAAADAGPSRAAGLGVSKAVGGFKPLPSVPAELAALIRDAGNPGGLLPGQRWLDEAFSRQALETAARSKPAVLHLASHFEFSPVSDQDSILLLGDGQRMSLAALRTDPMSFADIGLVTLSACGTALGIGTGAEIEGLSSVIRRKGADTVMASLWAVADDSTAHLMRQFYSHWNADGISRAEALRLAQLALLKPEQSLLDGARQRIARLLPWSSPTSAGAADRAGQSGHAHPYYWAPFVLIGQWF